MKGITPAHVQSFDDVKAQIESDLQRRRPAQTFAAAADQFQNLVYEQADSLAPAAKALDLKVETTPLVTRSQVQRSRTATRSSRRRCSRPSRCRASATPRRSKSPPIR